MSASSFKGIDPLCAHKLHRAALLPKQQRFSMISSLRSRRITRHYAPASAGVWLHIHVSVKQSCWVNKWLSGSNWWAVMICVQCNLSPGGLHAHHPQQTHPNTTLKQELQPEGANLWPWTHLILNTRLGPLWECVWACESVCFFKKRIAAPHEFINIQVVAVADQLCVCVHEYMEGRLTEVRTTHLLGKSCFSHADWPLVTNGPNTVTSNVTIPHQTIYLDRQLGRRTRLSAKKTKTLLASTNSFHI